MADFYEFQWSSRVRPTAAQTREYLDRRAAAINRNDANEKRKALNNLRDKVGASMDLVFRDKSCCTDDEFLMRFLFARKFDCDEAFQLLLNYHAYKQQNKALLQKLNVFDETIQLALRDGFPSILKERDRRGRKVMVFFAANWDPSAYPLETVYRAMLLSLEKLLEDVHNQAQGFIAIVDWTNFSLRQSSHLTPKILKLMIEGLQDCMPVRFKSIHFIGQPWYVETALAFIKPFMREKTRERIKLHGTNLSTLHELVHKDILPTELGGEGPILNTLDWYHELLESSQTVSDPKTYFITETTVYSKAPPTELTQSTTSSSSSVYSKADDSNFNNNILNTTPLLEIKSDLS